MVVKPASAELRKRCADRYGKEFAQKASDRLVQALEIRSFVTARESVAPPPQQQSMVLEMKTTEITPPPPAPNVAGAREAAIMAAGSRTHRAGALRESFYASVSTMRAELEKNLPKSASPMRESATDLGSATDVCWLNGTMRTLALPKTIADIAGDPKVTRIGIPRALVRELNVTAKTIGAITFRTANRVSGKDILVAVIDGEVDATQPAFKGRVLQKKNYTNEAWGHADAHGTFVGGIIASAMRSSRASHPAPRS